MDLNTFRSSLVEKENWETLNNFESVPHMEENKNKNSTCKKIKQNPNSVLYSLSL